MKIQLEQSEILRRQQELQSQKGTSASQKGAQDDFTTTFAQQMSLGSTESSTPPPPLGPGVQSGLVNQLLLGDVESMATSDGVARGTLASDSAKAFDRASGALDMWESYVNVLSTPGNAGNLRDAYGFLESVETQVATLKAESGPALEQNPNLANIVNELDVLTTTEKFKFNRGDYAV